MITAVFMIFFLGTTEVQFIADPTVHKTMEECERYSLEMKRWQQDLVAQGLSEPHVATFRCVNWGEGV